MPDWPLLHLGIKLRHEADEPQDADERRLLVGGHVTSAASSPPSGADGHKKSRLKSKVCVCGDNPGPELKTRHGGAKFRDRHVRGDPVLGPGWRGGADIYPQRTKQRVSLLASL